MNRKIISQNIRRKTEAKGMELGDVMTQSRIREDTWERYLKGTRTPSAYSLWRIARVLDCTMEELMEGIEDDSAVHNE